MKVLSFMLIISLALMMMACSSISVKTDYDKQYDFEKFKTYRWASGTEINPQDELQKHPLVLKRVIKSVDKTMSEKGMQLVEGDEYDLVVMGAPRPKGVSGLRSRMSTDTVKRSLSTPLMIAPYPKQ